MLQYILENINEIKVWLSYWNHFIIKHQINPSLCIKGVQPYSYISLSSKLKQQYLNMQCNLLLYEHKYDYLSSTMESDKQILRTEESSELLKRIYSIEKELLEYKHYISYLYNVKEIYLMV